MTHSITLTKPDDWHLHFRDGAALQTVVPHTARQFSRAIVMPNLSPPVTNVDAALAYRHRILSALNAESRFDPLMTLYLTDDMDPNEINKAKASGHIPAAKLYPAGATTNSAHGVTNIKNVYGILERMQTMGMVLCVHGEVTATDIDIFDREAAFIDQVLSPLLQDFPKLKVVFEHITTTQAAQFVASGPAQLAATITPQHLLYNRNEIFRGGIRPHFYCLPILKREPHRLSLLNAATSGSGKFFLGTDSAPHTSERKEASCGCAGCYSGFHALELYATAFESVGKLHQLEGFASFFGADFYGLPRNKETITLLNQSLQIPDSFAYLEDELIPLASGETLNWSLQSPNPL